MDLRPQPQPGGYPTPKVDRRNMLVYRTPGGSFELVRQGIRIAEGDCVSLEIEEYREPELTIESKGWRDTLVHQPRRIVRAVLSDRAMRIVTDLL